MEAAQPEPEASQRRWRAAIVVAAAVAFVCKVALALNTYGTNDVYAWERFAHWSALFGSGLYSVDPAFNHPPSMITVLGVMTWLSKVTGIFFPFWLRLPAIAADAASLWVVYRMFASRLDEPAVRFGLLSLALSPVLILVSGFHGNTDPVVIFFVLLAVWFTQKDAPDWQSGAAFGAAMCIKVLPLIVLPVLFFARPGLRRRAIFLTSLAAVMTICWSPYIFRNPAAIVHQVLGYQSIYGHWGLSWLACQFPSFQDSWHEDFRHYGAYVVLITIAVAAFLISRRASRPSLYAQVGAAFFFFLATSNGFGVQYLAWLVPWTVGLAVIPVAFFTAASGTFLFLVYNWWSGGFPWYLADSNYVGDFAGHLDYSLTLSWVSVIVLAGAAWNWRRAPSWPATRTWLSCLIILVFVLLRPAWHQLAQVDMRTHPPSVDRDAVNTIQAGERAMLSQVYLQMGRYQDAVVAARFSVVLDPSLLDAWNMLARSCIVMGRWDEALNAANHAIRIAPDDANANASLSEVLSHRR